MKSNKKLNDDDDDESRNGEVEINLIDGFEAEEAAPEKDLSSDVCKCPNMSGSATESPKK
jgi:hypothetical protein